MAIAGGRHPFCFNASRVTFLVGRVPYLASATRVRWRRPSEKNVFGQVSERAWRSRSMSNPIVGPEELSGETLETRRCHPILGRGARPPSHPHAPDPTDPRLGRRVSRSIASAGSAERGRADGFDGLAVCADSRRTFQRCGHYFHEFLRRSAVLLGARGHRGHQLRVLPAAELQAHARDGGHRGSVFGRFERTTRALLNRGPIRESRPRPLTGPVGSFSGAPRRESRPRQVGRDEKKTNRAVE